MPEKAVPYLDVSHVHSTENPKDLGGDTLQVCLGADQATGGQFLDDVQENGQRPRETELGGFVDLTVGRGGLGGVADDGGQLGEDLGPVERVFETGDFADNYGVLDGELGDRLGDGGGDEAGAEVGLFLVTYGAGEGQSVAGGGGGEEEEDRGREMARSLLVGRLPPVLVHTLFQGDDGQPADLDGQRAVEEDVLESTH